MSSSASAMEALSLRGASDDATGTGAKYGSLGTSGVQARVVADNTAATTLKREPTSPGTRFRATPPQNAETPVTVCPRISEWTSWVPS